MIRMDINDTTGKQIASISFQKGMMGNSMGNTAFAKQKSTTTAPSTINSFGGGGGGATLAQGPVGGGYAMPTTNQASMSGNFGDVYGSPLAQGRMSNINPLEMVKDLGLTGGALSMFMKGVDTGNKGMIDRSLSEIERLNPEKYNEIRKNLNNYSNQDRK